MSLSRFTADVKNHSSLPDKPVLTPEELKKLFDKAPADIKEYLNTVLLPEIDAVIEEKERQIEEVNKTKVDKEDGKSLSTNDFTDKDKEKLDGIETGATKMNIPYGTSVPTSSTAGDIYIQYFN